MSEPFLMSYEQAVDYVHSTEKLGWRPGLEIIGELLRRLGDPQKNMAFVHIAGTNGKGSTAALTAAALTRAGYKTGLFLSPYVEDFRERIQINGLMIEKDAFADIINRMIPVMDAMQADGYRHPTEFEIITAAAMMYYDESRADIVSLEVGLGGRFDATNAIDAPLVAVVTSISLDHTKILGDTVEKIAAEKCGIIKPSCKAVTYCAQSPAALEVIRADCTAKGVPLTIPNMERLKNVSLSLECSRFTYKGRDYSLALSGLHQVHNALTVIEILELLSSVGFPVPPEIAREALAETRFSGRLEIVRRRPLCITDGGHNTVKISALCSALDTLLGGRRLIAIMGISSDKEYEKCVAMVADRAEAFFAVAGDTPRALKPEIVARAAEGHCERVYIPGGIREAVSEAFAITGENDVILACGSLYFIGEAKRYMQDAEYNG